MVIMKGLTACLAANSSSFSQLRLLVTLTLRQRRYSSKDYGSSSDDESTPKDRSKPAKQSNQEPENASARLNRLLASMSTDHNKSLNTTPPGGTRKQLKENAAQAAAANDVIIAAKKVAAMIDGPANQQKTESELLAKLLGHDSASQRGATKANKDKGSSAQEVGSEQSLSELIVGMKIDRSQKTENEQSRSEFVRRTLSARRTHLQSKDRSYPSARDDRRRPGGGRPERTDLSGGIDLFGGPGLGIFPDKDQLKPSPDMLPTWERLYQHELKLLFTRAPANYFEKIARLTEEGKMWRFPIDNEQDYTEEIDVDFSEHVFLEQHLVPWCPDRGPIRHFMELVCVGLSKNPFVTAAEKKEHILWYRDYFAAKKELLGEFLNPTTSSQLSITDEATKEIQS